MRITGRCLRYTLSIEEVYSLSRWLFIFVLICSLIFGCATKPSVHDDMTREAALPPNAVERQFKAAQDEYQRGELDKAAGHLEDFVVQHPREPLTDDALYLLGEIYFKRGDYRTAAIQFERVVNYFPSSPLRQEGEWFLAKCYLKMGKYKDALRLARPLMPAFEDKPLRKGELSLLLGDCYAGMKDPMAALSWFARARRELPTPQREEVKGRIIELLDQDLAADHYQEVIVAYSGTFIASYARYRLAQVYFSKGKRDEAGALLMEAMKEAKGEAFYPRLEAFWREMQIGFGKEMVLGCILPLQGKGKGFGSRALRGIQLAIGAFRQVPLPFRVRLVLWDDRGEPARAKEGVRVLAEKEKAVAIIGPLQSQCALAAAEEAEVRKIPLITLSPLQGISQGRNYIFQNSITNASQVQTIVAYAIRERGLRTFACLYPRNSYGTSFKGAFQQEVERLGGKVVAAASYGDDQMDFGEVIRRIVRYPRQSGSSNKKIRAICDFSAIFIPDDVNRINLLVPQLAYHDVVGVQLLGNNGWNSAELLREGDKFYKGAIFCDGFFVDSPSPVVRSFVEAFFETFHTKPSLLEGLGYDTASFLMAVFEKTGGITPDRIISYTGYHGVTNLRGFTPQGEGIRDLFLLTVKDGAIRQLAPFE